MKNGLKNSDNEDFKIIGKIIEETRVAMLTTFSSKGKLASRPMYAQEIDEKGFLWFFSSDEQSLVQEIRKQADVNVTFADADDNEFVSIFGAMEIIYDKAKMEELWDPSLKIWYKDGIETPGICLLKLTFQEAEYWDSPQSPVAKIVGLVKILAGGDAKIIGRHNKIDCTHEPRTIAP